MLLWRILVEAATSRRIDRYSKRARVWIHEHIPELCPRLADEKGRALRKSGRNEVIERFNWEEEWPKWQQCFRALLWLAHHREHPPRPGSAEDRIPGDVDDVLVKVVERTRNTILGSFFSDAKPVVLFSGGFNATQQFDSLNEFWEVVFFSFFQSDALPHSSACSECGASLPPTRQKGKASKAKLCGKCRVKKWRRDHPDQAREMGKLAKRNEREAYKKELARRTQNAT